jgi:hypothetical protein
VRTLKARWSEKEGILGETFSGRLGDYMVSCMARLKATKVGKFKANGCLVGLIR